MTFTYKLSKRLAQCYGALMVAGLALGACTADRLVTAFPSQIARVFVTPESLTIDPGQTLQFLAYGRTAAGDSLAAAVTWSASSGVISPSGFYAADTSTADATVTATLASASLSASARVRKRRIVALVISPSPVTLPVGGSQGFSTFGVRNTGDTVSVNATYSATGGTITNGVFVAGSTTGTYRVIAQHSQTGLADTAAVTVTAAPSVPVATVTVSPAAAGLTVGGAVQLTATTLDSAGTVLTGRSVMWSTSDAGVAGVSGSGRVTGVAAGNATITATSEGQTGSATVTVTVVPVASVVVTPPAASLTTGGTVQLTAITKDSAGGTLTGRAVTWASSNAAVAPVTGGGLVTGVAAGSATITATSEGKAGSAAVTVATAGTAHVGYYAAVNGSSSGTGSINSPWNLATALAGAGGKVKPGDTVWVRGGTYYAPFRSTLVGSALAPIVVRAYPGERAIIDGVNTTSDNFIVAGSYTVIWGLEFTNTAPSRYTTLINHNYRADNIINNGPHNKYINLIVHDGGVAFYTYSSQADVEITGGIFYNNGWEAPDRGHGHALYLKNDVGPVVARDNVIFNQFGYGIHVYTNTGDGLLNNIQLIGNVSFDNGSLASTGTSANIGNLGQPLANDLGVIDNMTYFAPSLSGTNLTLGSGSGLTATGNYVVGGSGITQGTWSGATIAGNTVLSAAAATRPTAVFVRPNAYEPGRANIIVYNWSGVAAIQVSLAGVLPVGAAYEVHNVQDLFGAPVASGTFGGSSITLPMVAVQPPVPVGMSTSPAPSTGTAFNVYVVTVVP